MKKGWRVILGIVLVAVVFGGLCCGVGLLTGADFERIVLNLDEHYQLTSYVENYVNYVSRLFQNFIGLF